MCYLVAKDRDAHGCFISISISIPILCASAHFCVTEFKNIGA